MSAPPAIRIATRKSKLALWQAEYVAAELAARYPQTAVSLLPMSTRGDKILDAPLAKIGGKGLFIKELETAITHGEADIAVHSMKDVGVDLPPGFAIAAILAREDPADAWVSNTYPDIEALPRAAVVGTCSLRRRMQLARLRPDLQLRDLRGNVQTRLERLDRGEFDGIVLACAGLKRLGLEARIRSAIDFDLSLPAIGQGAIGIECRQDSPFFAAISVLEDADTALCVKTERIINQRLQGSCQVPLAAYATLEGDSIRLRARLGTPDGRTLLQFDRRASRGEAAALAHRAADHLIAQGAEDILRALSAP